jgi:hypothetical protein
LLGFPLVHSPRDMNTRTISALSAALLRGEVLEARIRGFTVRALRDVDCELATWICEVDGLVQASGDPFDVAVAYVNAREEVGRNTLPAPRPSFPALRDVPTQPLPSVPSS